MHEAHPSKGIAFTILLAAESGEHKIRIALLVGLLLNLVSNGSTELDFSLYGIVGRDVGGADIFRGHVEEDGIIFLVESEHTSHFNTSA